MELQHLVHASDVHSIREEIRKETLDIYNRLQSVNEDIAFVTRVHTEYPNLPLMPNLRCGAWYADPEMAQGRFAYFKSTDGHNNNWSFNLRRPNLHLLSVLDEHDGVLLVDSTRSGKRMPDALSKTVPIWCEVINRAIQRRYGSSTFQDQPHRLYTPASSVSAQEHHQIEIRLEGWSQLLAESSYAIPRLRAPLKPIWITPDTTLLAKLPPPDQCLVVVCVCASRRVELGMDRRSAGYTYVQGSADDHELWSMGLTPELFWRQRSRLLQARRNELPRLIATLLSGDKPCTNGAMQPSPIAHVHGRLQLCALSELPAPLPATLYNSTAAHLVQGDEQDSLLAAYVLIAPDSEDNLHTQTTPEDSESSHALRLSLPGGKRGQMAFLKGILPRAIPFIRDALSRDASIVVACESGNDVSAGIIVAALQLFFQDDGQLCLTRSQTQTKDSIRTRLQWIISSRPQANPSRTTLKRVNEFLLSPPSFRV